MLERWRIIISALVLVVSFTAACSREATKDFDILIKGGELVDGTGNPGTHGDIGITGDVIVEIGDLADKAARVTIDAEGLVVSPGFIDMHTNCAEGLGKPDSNANLNYLTQGVTTVVTGNCGSGTFRVSETKAKWNELGIGTNAVHLVGFGEVRSAVMGEEARAPQPEELEKMRSIVRQAMKEGAWGMSTGLEYVPGRYSTTEEIIEVTKVVGEFGGFYASHQRNEFDGVPDATRETIRIAEESGVRVCTSHLKVCRKNYWGVMKEVVELINDARDRGIDIVADMYPFHFAGGGPIIPIRRNSGWSPFHLPHDMEPFAALRERLRDQSLGDSERDSVRELYIDELAKALSDESKRAEIKQSVLAGSPDKPSSVALAGWDSYLVAVTNKNTHLIGKILSDIAEEQGRDPFDVAANLVIEDLDLYVACGVMSADDMTLAMEQDWLMFVVVDFLLLTVTTEEQDPISQVYFGDCKRARILETLPRDFTPPPSKCYGSATRTLCASSIAHVRSARQPRQSQQLPLCHDNLLNLHHYTVLRKRLGTGFGKDDGARFGRQWKPDEYHLLRRRVVESMRVSCF